MTHEYTIATGGVIAGTPTGPGIQPATAIAWAADTVLAVGTDAEMRALSRGDSIFLDLAGATICATRPVGGPLATGDPADLDVRAADGTLIARVVAGHFDHPDPHHGPLRILRADGTSGTIR
jgi:hypothetical protein